MFKMFKKLMLMTALFVSMTIMAQSRETTTITVCDGTTQSLYMPIYTGDNVSQMNTMYAHKNQFIIPASELTAMNGGTITKMGFHLATSSGNTNDFCGNSTYKIYLLEVDYTTLSQYEQEGEGITATKVYEGRLNINNVGELSFGGADAAENYIYMGGNLMVTITKNRVYSATMNLTKFYGQATEQNTSWHIIYKNDTGGTDLNRALQFLPKTTFTYEPAEGTSEINAMTNPMGYGTVEGAGSYDNGTFCTLTATPNTDYRFLNWTEDGTVVSTNDIYTFMVIRDRDLVANFARNTFDITATANPTEGGSVEGSGTYNYDATCTLTATASTGYHFVNWTEDGSVVSTDASYSFIVNDDRTLVANFALNDYTITASANPAIGGNVDGAGTYAHGTTCTVTASPNTNCTFNNWTENGNVVSTDATYSFTVTGDRTLVANFTLPQTYTITATPNPLEGGRVTMAYRGNRNAKSNRSIVFSDDFENGFANWTTIDADGDGNNWYSQVGVTDIYGHNNSQGLATSASWANQDLTPDNYLVSPQVALGGTFSFWACAQDYFYPDEHFGVAISTTSNTNPSAFTTIQQWTMTAKSDVQGEWWEYAVDLSAYEGQTGYIAIRHFDTRPMFRLNIDDVELSTEVIEPDPDLVFSDDFRYGIGNWTLIDADGDGNNWYSTIDNLSPGHDDRVGIACSRSRDENNNPLTPDNYLVTPQLPLNGTFSFWAMTFWVSSEENVGVAVSTTSNTNAAAFTTLAEWNLIDSITGPGVHWFHYSVDLSAYEGQMGYIAIRHFNTTNQLWLSIDDVELRTSSGGPVNPDPETGETVSNVFIEGQTCVLTAIPFEGYHFAGWTENGTVVSTEAVYSFTVGSDRNLEANFDFLNGVEEQQSNAMVYPNPTSGDITVECEGLSHVHIVNALGQTVYSADHEGQQVRIDLSGMAKGIYMMHIEATEGQTVKKIVVK